MSTSIDQIYPQLKFQSHAALGAQITKLAVAPSQIGPLLTRYYSVSDARALFFCQSVFHQKLSEADGLATIKGMVGWANKGGFQQQSIIAKSFQRQEANLYLVREIAMMTRPNARSFVKAYFDAGGDMRSIAQYLVLAGRVLKRHPKRHRGSDGIFDWVGDAAEWVGDKLEDAWDATSQAVTTLVDAVVFAGKKLADVVREVGEWTVEQVTGLVTALVEAGKNVVEILDAALEVGLDALEKFVEASIQAGLLAVDVLKWAQDKAFEAVAITLEGLLDISVTLAEVVKDVCTDIGEEFRKGFFKGLIAIGKGVLDILKAALEGGVSVLGVAFTVLLDTTGHYRELNADERLEALRVFGDSIDLSRVRIADASLAVDATNLINGACPFTTMYYINFASWRHVDKRTLIHELTHVWQGEVKGPVYMAQALESQFFGRGYKVTPEELENNNGDFGKFEPEQQAEIVETYWHYRWEVNPPAPEYYGPYERYAQAVYVPPLGTVAALAQPLVQSPREYHELVPTLIDGRTLNPRFVELEDEPTQDEKMAALAKEWAAEYKRGLEQSRRKPRTWPQPQPWIEKKWPGPTPVPVPKPIPVPIPKPWPGPKLPGRLLTQVTAQTHSDKPSRSPKPKPISRKPSGATKPKSRSGKPSKPSKSQPRGAGTTRRR